jgi:hypothetical protein
MMQVAVAVERGLPKDTLRWHIIAATEATGEAVMVIQRPASCSDEASAHCSAACWLSLTE